MTRNTGEITMTYTPIENPKDFMRLSTHEQYTLLTEPEREMYLKDEETYRRFKVMKAMDILIRNLNNGGLAFDDWLMVGVPDGTPDDVLFDYVREDEQFEEWTALFRDICGWSKDENDYWACFRHVKHEDEE